MANENDELQQNSDSDNHSSSNNTNTGTQQTKATTEPQAAIASLESRNRDQQNDENKEGESYCNRNALNLTGAKGKLNDLVADLYMSTTISNGPATTGSSSAAATEATLSNPGYGDYTNIRATCGPTTAGFSEGPNREISGSSIATASITTAPPTQNTFSFKHFLNSNAGNTHAPSSTVTSLDVLINVNTSLQHNNTTSNATTSTVVTSSTASSSSFQTSTGARPKVPQSSSISATSISSLMSGGGSTLETTASGTKMKRSPRFSSFDSQASLAGAAAEATAEEEAAATGSTSFSGFRLHPETERVDIFGARRIPTGGCANTSTTNSSDYDERTQFVPRSYSHYDMQMPPPSSPRRRIVCGGGAAAAAASDTRPNRLSLAPSNKPRVRLEAHCFPGELPAETAAPPRPNAADFPAAAAALPDFVQDHWLDSWYASEMHLNSPPNSPVCDFVQDLTGGAGSISGAVNSGGNGGGGVAASLHDDNPSFAATIGGVGGTEPPSQRLPDFLSDGPIIHSSQRLADVAAGLPSNLMNSPEDATMKLQLTSLRIENERYRRELSEARTALTEQTRRANELERQLLEAQRVETAYNRSISQQNLAAAQVEECLDQSKRRQAATQSHATKLKQQVKQLTAEIDFLRRENESLREDGAVGGCDRAGGGGSGAGAAVGGGGINRGDIGARGGGNTTIRPSRSQQISRDLLRAATNAESNLRQLLAGVDNLRQMATDIENSELRLEYDVSPDLFSDFLDECDDYEEYPGGPAL